MKKPKPKPLPPAPAIVPEETVRQLLLRWHDRLGLGYCEVRFKYERDLGSEENGKSIDGYVHHAQGLQLFTIYIQWSEDFDRLRQTCIHELLHIDLMLPRALRKAIPKLPRALIEERHEHCIHRMTRFLDGLTEFDDEDLRP